jgi:cytochrome c biogenesis protein CcdA
LKSIKFAEEVQMKSSDINKSQVRYARLAGFMFLFVDVSYALGLLSTSRFQVLGNFGETAHRIASILLVVSLPLQLAEFFSGPVFNLVW